MLIPNTQPLPQQYFIVVSPPLCSWARSPAMSAVLLAVALVHLSLTTFASESNIYSRHYITQ